MVITKLEMIRRKFYYGGSLDSSKLAWIAWDKVISHRNHGGLDIGSLRGFSVKGVRKHNVNSTFSTNISPTRWNKLVPIKVNVAYRRNENQRIPTRVDLDYRGIDLHSIRCLVCDDDLETEEHILVKCVVAKNTSRDP
nr:RNA-directed DNA polymerase, eukaryota, reverse transcriptase zinc-binding domain protein [Tanacetum cinerariifolium]GEX35625.1 RNA-directed DNA polymerase, eukaryota, reverse transcriptase zinc-binding domain protein [Tanacetum cinerariifolium]